MDSIQVRVRFREKSKEAKRLEWENHPARKTEVGRVKFPTTRESTLITKEKAEETVSLVRETIISSLVSLYEQSKIYLRDLGIAREEIISKYDNTFGDKK